MLLTNQYTTDLKQIKRQKRPVGNNAYKGEPFYYKDIVCAFDIETSNIKYKEEYGDGLTLNYAWVKNGIMYHHSAAIRGASPDRKLNLKWTTFRDRLTPGQKETWTLSVTDEKGKPAKAQLMATMYDISLDAIYPHDWNLDVN